MTMLPKALVIGAQGTIGTALCDNLAANHEVHQLARSNCDFTEESLQQHAQSFQELGKFSKIICTIGVLHDDLVQPEKRIKELDQEKLAHYFLVNSILPLLCLKHFQSLLDKQSKSVFASLSAMVGSTKDNQLGGWYGYRASKAALNSMIKTASIEIARTHKQSAVIAIHPGTTVGDLSSPFAKNVKPGKYYSPQQSAERIIGVINAVTAGQTGSFFNWDGQLLDW